MKKGPAGTRRLLRPDHPFFDQVLRRRGLTTTDDGVWSSLAMGQTCPGLASEGFSSRCGRARRAGRTLRIPVKTTTHSDAWRPPVLIDDDPCGAGAPSDGVGDLSVWCFRQSLIDGFRIGLPRLRCSRSTGTSPRSFRRRRGTWRSLPCLARPGSGRSLGTQTRRHVAGRDGRLSS